VHPGSATLVVLPKCANAAASLRRFAKPAQPATRAGLSRRGCVARPNRQARQSFVPPGRSLRCTRPESRSTCRQRMQRRPPLRQRTPVSCPSSGPPCPCRRPSAQARRTQPQPRHAALGRGSEEWPVRSLDPTSEVGRATHLTSASFFDRMDPCQIAGSRVGLCDQRGLAGGTWKGLPTPLSRRQPRLRRAAVAPLSTSPRASFAAPPPAASPHAGGGTGRGWPPCTRQ